MKFLWLLLITAQSYGQTNIFPSDGDVGIGTTSPSARLDVNGNFKLTGTQIYNTLNNQTIGSPSWIKLGRILLPQQGNNACIRVYGGNGFNASINQQGYIEIHIRTSNAHSVDAQGYPFSAFASSSGRNNFVRQIKIVPDNSEPYCDRFSIYINCNSYIGNSFYSVESSSGQWTPINLATDDPGQGYLVPYESVINNDIFITTALV